MWLCVSDWMTGRGWCRANEWPMLWDSLPTSHKLAIGTAPQPRGDALRTRHIHTQCKDATAPHLPHKTLSGIGSQWAEAKNYVWHPTARVLVPHPISFSTLLPAPYPPTVLPTAWLPSCLLPPSDLLHWLSMTDINVSHQAWTWVGRLAWLLALVFPAL